MKKILLFGIPAILIIILIYFFVFRNKNTTEQGTATKEIATPVSLPASNTKLESTNEGKLIYKASSGNISMNNFAKNAEIADNGVIYLVDKENYNIGYNSTSKEFIITLLVNNNIENTRKEAESDLLASLDISKEDACKLKVYLYVSAAITTDKSFSQNHGLFFCPGSITFPN